MNILFVQSQPCIRALKYAEGLCMIDSDISLSFAYSGKTLSELYGYGDEYFGAWFPLDDDPAAKLRKLVETYDINIIHSHNAPDTLTNLCIDLFSGKIPIVHDIHDLMSARNTPYEDGLIRETSVLNLRKEEQRAIERSDAIITVSDIILNIARRKGYRLPKIAYVYENYIPERFIPKTLPKVNQNFANRPIRIVYEGFISSNGGHYDMRSIFRALAAEGIEVHIYPSRENLDYQILSDTAQNIFYHPSIAPDKLLKEIKKYDFGWAGFNDTLNREHLNTVLPNKLFEYIASGLPVISFPHNALKRFLGTHRLGLVVNEVYGLNGRLRDPGMAAIRENVRAHRWDFTVEANIGYIVNIYMQLCGKPLLSAINREKLN